MAVGESPSFQVEKGWTYPNVAPLHLSTRMGFNGGKQEGQVHQTEEPDQE